MDDDLARALADSKKEADERHADDAAVLAFLRKFFDAGVIILVVAALGDCFLGVALAYMSSSAIGKDHPESQVLMNAMREMVVAHVVKHWERLYSAKLPGSTLGYATAEAWAADVGQPAQWCDELFMDAFLEVFSDDGPNNINMWDFTKPREELAAITDIAQFALLRVGDENRLRTLNAAFLRGNHFDFIYRASDSKEPRSPKSLQLIRDHIRVAAIRRAAATAALNPAPPASRRALGQPISAVALAALRASVRPGALAASSVPAPSAGASLSGRDDTKASTFSPPSFHSRVFAALRGRDKSKTGGNEKKGVRPTLARASSSGAAAVAAAAAAAEDSTDTPPPLLGFFPMIRCAHAGCTHAPFFLSAKARRARTAFAGRDSGVPIAVHCHKHFFAAVEAANASGVRLPAAKMRRRLAAAARTFVSRRWERVVPPNTKAISPPPPPLPLPLLSPQVNMAEESGVNGAAFFTVPDSCSAKAASAAVAAAADISAARAFAAGCSDFAARAAAEHDVARAALQRMQGTVDVDACTAAVALLQTAAAASANVATKSVAESATLIASAVAAGSANVAAEFKGTLTLSGEVGGTALTGTGTHADAKIVSSVFAAVARARAIAVGGGYDGGGIIAREGVRHTPGSTRPPTLDIYLALGGNASGFIVEQLRARLRERGFAGLPPPPSPPARAASATGAALPSFVPPAAAAPSASADADDASGVAVVGGGEAAAAAMDVDPVPPPLAASSPSPAPAATAAQPSDVLDGGANADVVGGDDDDVIELDGSDSPAEAPADGAPPRLPDPYPTIDVAPSAPTDRDALVVRIMAEPSAADRALIESTFASHRALSPDIILSRTHQHNVTVRDLMLLRPGISGHPGAWARPGPLLYFTGGGWRDEPNPWANDNIMNIYGEGLAFLGARNKRTFVCSSFLYAKLIQKSYTYDKSVQGYFRLMGERFDPFSYEYLLIPVNLDQTHWVLGVVNMRAHTVAVLDSLNKDEDDTKLNRQEPAVAAHIIRLMGDAFRHSTGKALPQPFVHVLAPLNLSRQTNGNDCAIFVCAYMTCLLYGIPPCAEVFKQKNMLLWRLKIAVACLKASFTDERGPP